jgi:hypothetical protein
VSKEGTTDPTKGDPRHATRFRVAHPASGNQVWGGGDECGSRQFVALPGSGLPLARFRRVDHAPV